MSLTDIFETMESYSQHINKELIEENKLLTSTVKALNKIDEKRIQQLEEGVKYAIKSLQENPYHKSYAEQTLQINSLQSLLTDER